MSKEQQNNQKKILEFIGETEKEAANIFVEDKRIAKNLEIDIREVQDHLEILEDDGKIQLAKAFGPSFGALLTAEGRMSLRYEDEFQENAKENTVKSGRFVSWLHAIDAFTGLIARIGKNTAYIIGCILTIIGIVIYLYFHFIQIE